MILFDDVRPGDLLQFYNMWRPYVVRRVDTAGRALDLVAGDVDSSAAWTTRVWEGGLVHASRPKIEEGMQVRISSLPADRWLGTVVGKASSVGAGWWRVRGKDGFVRAYLEDFLTPVEKENTEVATETPKARFVTGLLPAAPIVKVEVKPTVNGGEIDIVLSRSGLAVTIGRLHDGKLHLFKIAKGEAESMGLALDENRTIKVTS